MIDAQQRLPSGLVVELLAWTTADMMRMARTSAQARSLLVADLLGRVRVAENPLGLYGLKEGQSLDPPRLLVGDRIALTLAMRIFSLNQEDFTFPFTCERCDHQGTWSLDLRRLLLPALPDTPEGEALGIKACEVGGQAAALYAPLGDKPILLGDRGAEERVFLFAWDEAQASKFARGESEIFRCENGDEIHWKHLTEKMGRALATKKIDPRKEPDRLMLAAIRAQVVEIRSGGESLPESRFNEFLSGLLWRDIDRFNKQRDELACGVDAAIDIACPACGHAQWVEMPMQEEPAFFSPSSESARSRGRSRR
jgi:hypothetical protein